MKKKFKCPVCGDLDSDYKRPFHYECVKKAEMQGLRQFWCNNMLCEFCFEFQQKDYRKIKFMLFPEKKTCNWKYEYEYTDPLHIKHGEYKTGCKNMLYHEGEKIKDFKFCPYCGGEIIE